MKTLFRTLLLLVAASALAPVLPAQPSPATAAQKDSGLRRLDVPPDPGSAPDEADEPPAPIQRGPRRHRSGENRVTVLSDNHVSDDEAVRGNAVCVLGNLRVEGTVDGDAVTVLGDTDIEGNVHGRVVTVLGDLTLGPDSVVDGDVNVCGALRRAPGSIVHGRIVQQSGAHMRAESLAAVLRHGVNGPWLWLANLLILAFYALVALVAPRGIRACGDMMAHRPGLTVFSALLALIALPILFVLLLLTVIGIPIAVIVIPVALVAMAMFGKASFYALIGRAITRDRVHPSVAVLVGGVVILAIFMIPYVGFPLSLLLSVFGLGSSIAAIFTATRRPPVPPAPSASPAAPSAPAPLAMPPPLVVSQPQSAFDAGRFPDPTAAAAAEAPPARPAEPPAAAQVPEPAPFAAPPVAPPETSLIRAGFWIRTGALFIDLLLIGIAFAPLFSHFVLLMLALYGAVMWKLKGTTIGGIICGLRVVRLDGRPIDWPTAGVRALGCFLSLIPAGFGFVWVAFDPQRQSWHDKIAGTAVVRLPRGLSLV